MRIVSVVGTRPQLIKAAALQPVLRARHEETFVDTGQHWDDAMAGSFFAELGLARPDYSLGAGGGTHAQQTAAMLVALEPILESHRPGAVLVYGDTNSTLAGALAAAKLGIPVAHVEAGVRSFDRRMPEELNRVVADHVATWRLAPTQAAVDNLRAEGIVEGVSMVGDLMLDLAARISVEVRDPSVLARMARSLASGLAPGDPMAPRLAALQPGEYVVATIHRQENREPSAIAAWARLLRDAARADRPVVLPLHPGTRAALGRHETDLGPDVAIVEPLSYRTSLALQLHAAAVLTDSGGVQREAAWLGVPCLVLRRSTEWADVAARSHGGSSLVGLDTAAAARQLLRLAPPDTAPAAARRRAAGLDLRGDGAPQAIVAALPS